MFAQSFHFEEDWRWSHFTTESGLPSNKILQIVEAHDGVIWAVSLNEVAWFDGYRWITIDSKKGLPAGQISGIERNGFDSNIIVLYVDKYFFGNRESFQQLNNFQHVNCLVALKDEYLFINSNYEMCSYRHGTMKVIRQNTFELFSNKFGDVWFTSDSGLYFLSKDGFSQKLSTSSYIRLDIVNENSHKNGLLVIERPKELQGIWEWDSTRVLKHNLAENGFNIVASAMNEQNDVVCVYRSGLVRIRQNNKWFTPSYAPSQLRHSNRLIFDKNGNLWLTTNEGVFLYRTSNSLWTYHNENSLDLRNNINAILPLPDGNIWLGTGNGVVIVHPNETEQWIKDIDNHQLGAVTGMEQANDGTIWITSGSSFSGTYRWNGTKWKHYDIGNDPLNTMIHKIHKDKNGDLWFLGLAKKGLYKEISQPGVFLFQNMKFIPWGDIHHLPEKRVYAFSEGPDQSYWFGTSKGIYRWQSDSVGTKTDIWKQWSGRESGLITSGVFTLAVDKNNEVWFGHGFGLVSYGLGKINSSGSISYLTIKDGLIENHVSDLAFDSSGTLWITTNGGLSSYKDGVWRTIGENTGLICSILWPVKPRVGKIFVGTLGKGLAVLNRNELASPSPKIILSSPFVEESKVNLQWKLYGFMGIPPQENILTRYKLNNNEWSSWSTYHSLSMVNLDPGDYTFQVQARDIYGQYTENGSHATFTILPPIWRRPIFFLPSSIVGIAFLSLIFSYYNRKRKSDIALRKSEEKFRIVSETTTSAVFIFTESSILYANPAAVRLSGYQIDMLLQMKFQDIIHPVFDHPLTERNIVATNLQHKEVKLIQFDHTERWIEITTSKILFQGVEAILAAMFDITERKNSERQLRELAFELSRTEERERRHLASYLHDTISQNLAFLKLKFRTFIKSESLPESDEKTEEMKGIIENLIQDSQTLTFELSPPILVELGLKAALEWLSERILERHHIQCNMTYDLTNTISYEIQSLLFNSVQELTTNVVKHAKASKISINVSSENSTTVVSVEDNGIGLRDNHTPKPTGKSGGFGLFYIRQRITALGGTIEFLNIQPTGSRIIITLPFISFEESIE